MVFIRRLVWDEWNVEHIRRHQVSQQDVEEVCHGTPMERETYKGRLRLVGPNAVGNLLTAIIAPSQEAGAYYVVTARPASRNERRRYREVMRGEE